MAQSSRGAGVQDGAHLGRRPGCYSPHTHHPEGSPGSWSEGGAMAQQFARCAVENKKSLFTSALSVVNVADDGVRVCAVCTAHPRRLAARTTHPLCSLRRS